MAAAHGRGRHVGLRLGVNASACLGCGCVGSCPPLRLYRRVACGRSIQSSRVEIKQIPENHSPL
eukprot:6392620-Prymnesium_polylepis.1